jgi:hypothetical protein
VTARDLLLGPADAGHQFAQYLLGCMMAIGEADRSGKPGRDAGWTRPRPVRNHAVATRAAQYRDQIDKNLFTANSSGFAYLGLAAFIIVGGLAAGGLASRRNAG